SSARTYRLVISHFQNSFTQIIGVIAMKRSSCGTTILGCDGFSCLHTDHVILSGFREGSLLLFFLGFLSAIVCCERSTVLRRIGYRLLFASLLPPLSPSPHKRHRPHSRRLLQLRLHRLNRPHRRIARRHPRRQSLLERRLRKTLLHSVSRLQSVPRRVRRVVAVHLLHIFNSIRIANQVRQRSYQLCAAIRDHPLGRVQHLVHQHPSADAIVICRHRPRQPRASKHVAHLFCDRRLVCPPRKRIRRKIDRINPFTRTVEFAPRHNFARQFTRRRPMRHVLPIRRNPLLRR